jgi:uncharacterized protein YkwD
MNRFARYATGALVVVLLVGAVLATRAAQPRYIPAGANLELGPAARHTSAPADLLAQIATGALSTAAGAAGGDLADLRDNTAPTPQEQTLLDLTNADRANNGLPPLIFDPSTLRVARTRAAAQIPDGPLSHYNSLGELAFVGLLADAGAQYTLAGENLARAASQDAGIVARLDEALMNSPTHRANILEPSFTMVSIGAASGPDGRPLAFAEIFRSTTRESGSNAASGPFHQASSTPTR